ncbi:MAG: HNH endonuclease [bacterium]
MTSALSTARRAVSGLSDNGLLNATAKLVNTERLTTLEILVHLNEVEKRELYLTLGCGSMYDYCVNHLGYSRSAAWRRIHSARCIVRFPEVYALVETGALNLTTLSMVATALTNDNKTELLGRIRGRSQDEVEEVLASYRPPAAFRDRVKPVRVAVPVTAGSPALNRFRAATRSTDGGSESRTESGTGSEPKDGSEAAAHQLTGSDASVTGTSREDDPSGADNRSAGSVNYMIKKQLLIQFLAGEGFMVKYQEVRSLLSNKLTELSFETVFETLLDDYLNRHSPAKKQERREKRAAVKEQREERAAVEKQREKRAAVKEQREKGAAVTKQREKRAGVKKEQAERRTKAKPTESTEARETDRPNSGDGDPSASKDKLSRKKFDEHSRSGSKIILLTSSDDDRDSNHDAIDEHNTKRADRNTAPVRSRHIPAKTRDAVFVRDKNRCTHVGPNGKRCESTYRLHIDHIAPYARGGTNALSNLRLLCAKHNKLEAKRVYGAARIDAHRKRE